MSVNSLTVPNNFDLKVKKITATDIDLPGLIPVPTPNDTNAGNAGVPIGGLYRDTADPATIYIRLA